MVIDFLDDKNECFFLTPFNWGGWIQVNLWLVRNFTSLLLNTINLHSDFTWIYGFDTNHDFQTQLYSALMIVININKKKIHYQSYKDFDISSFKIVIFSIKEMRGWSINIKEGTYFIGDILFVVIKFVTFIDVTWIFHVCVMGKLMAINWQRHIIFLMNFLSFLLSLNKSEQRIIAYLMTLIHSITHQ